ncbi:hypothetical protein BJ741DRAFT_610071, partial [Chytriomyces cf. hyalinus JEL632]
MDWRRDMFMLFIIPRLFILFMRPRLFKLFWFIFPIMFEDPAPPPAMPAIVMRLFICCCCCNMLMFCAAVAAVEVGSLFCNSLIFAFACAAYSSRLPLHCVYSPCSKFATVSFSFSSVKLLPGIWRRIVVLKTRRTAQVCEQSYSYVQPHNAWRTRIRSSSVAPLFI